MIEPKQLQIAKNHDPFVKSISLQRYLITYNLKIWCSWYGEMFQATRFQMVSMVSSNIYLENCIDSVDGFVKQFKQKKYV